jgi:hypothetical protein
MTDPIAANQVLVFILYSTRVYYSRGERNYAHFVSFVWLFLEECWKGVFMGHIALLPVVALKTTEKNVFRSNSF